MNIGPRRQFWSLRETPVIRRIELACVAIALALCLALLGTSPNQAARASAIASVAVASRVVAFSDTRVRRCIRRVVDLGHSLSEADIRSRINDECFKPLRPQPTSTPPAVLVCVGPIGLQTLAELERVTGCLLD